MNHLKRAMLGATAALLLSVGCDNKEEEAKRAQEEAASAASAAAKAQAEADEKLREAEAEAAKKTRADASAQLQKELDAHSRKADYWKDKVSKAKGATKKNAEAARSVLDTRMDAAKASVAKLDPDQGAEFETLRAEADKDVKAVGEAVESLEATLKTVK